MIDIILPGHIILPVGVVQGHHDIGRLRGCVRRQMGVAKHRYRCRLSGHRNRLAGIPSERDPELSTTSAIQMLPSGWITRWTNQGLSTQTIPCNRRQDFCCAGKIDWSLYIVAIRDSSFINHKAAYGATEMVIAVRP